MLEAKGVAIYIVCFAHLQESDVCYLQETSANRKKLLSSKDVEVVYTMTRMFIGFFFFIFVAP